MGIHYNQFYEAIEESCREWQILDFEKLVFIENIEGKLNLLIKTESQETIATIQEDLNRIDDEKNFFDGDFYHWKNSTKKADKKFYEEIWEEAEKKYLYDKIRFLSRVRNRGFWFKNSGSLYKRTETPKVAVFYSFKGGVGRTTSLAYVALKLAKEGKKVIVVDSDLDAPGVGLLFPPSSGDSGLGLLDYLIEKDLNFPIKEYAHTFQFDKHKIEVFPSALIDGFYLSKLSRLDLEPDWNNDPFKGFVEKVKQEYNPDYILIDGRAGLSDSSGMLLNGFAQLYVLLGTISEQSWKGLEYVIERLGKQRIQSGLEQANCLLVQTMIPAGSADSISNRFRDVAKDVFGKKYYYEATEREKGWSKMDLNNPKAPHNHIPIRYMEAFAAFETPEQLHSDLLKLNEHELLFQRIKESFD